MMIIITVMIAFYCYKCYMNNWSVVEKALLPWENFKKEL